MIEVIGGLDIHKLFRDGYCVGELCAEDADRVYAEMTSEAWIPISPNPELVNRNGDKYYSNRYIAARSLMQPTNLRSVYAEFMDAVFKWAEPVLKNYAHGDRALVSAFCGVEGYEMALHTDVGDRSVFDVLLYVGNDLSESTGGALRVCRVDLNNPFDVQSEHLADIYPRHGLIVVLNKLNPTIFHQALTLTGTGIQRYQLFSSFGLAELPEWHYDFPETRGFIPSIENLTFNDIDKIQEILATHAHSTT